ncbi:hypothetical protein BKA82DRAFT_2823218 [Pisolithus tinctorius]|nr:hypothetical protein BKA82DRAFT_2823218 [Pisolithus tinctorius]
MAPNNGASRHSDFYISTVIFLVEDSLFRVPREPFQQESDVFCDIFPCHKVTELLWRDQATKIPIQLHGTSKDDFEQLLKVLLHRKYGSQPNLPQSIEQWTSVLKLSTAWSFEKLRQVSINALMESGIGAVDRVVLSHSTTSRAGYCPL